MAEQNILLRISTKGDFASLKAGWDMLSSFAGTVKETIGELDKFKVVLNQVDMQMVNYADSAAKGQVDTFELMKGLQRLNKAGVEITQEELKILTVRATDLAKATGQDATEAFTRLTTGIAKGSSRALTEYGVRLKESTNLSEVQADAIKRLTEGFEDLTIELETDTERMTALGNAWGTAKGLMWDALTQNGTFLGTAIDTVTGALNEMNESLTRMNNNTKSYLFSLTNFVDSLKLGFAYLLEGIAQVNEALGFSPEMTAGYMAWAKGIRKEISTDLEMRGIYVPGRSPFQDRKDEPKKSTTEGMGGRSGPGGRRKKKQEKDIGPSGPSSNPFARLGGRYERIDTREGVSTEGEYAINAQEQADAEERLIALKQREFGIQQEIAELKEAELFSMREAMVDNEARLALLKDEEYIEARLAQLREEDEIYQAEREIYMAYEREQAVEFAYSFNRAWGEAYKTISAGANAARYTQDLLKQSWAAYVTNVITGVGSLKEALKEILVAIGIRIAIEEGWLALKDFAAAASSFARDDYAAGVKLLASGAMHTALAAIAGGAAGAASRIGSGSSAGRSSAASAGGGGATPSYGGVGYSGSTEGRQKIEVLVTVDESANLYAIVKKGNTMERRAGGSYFVEDDAA